MAAPLEALLHERILVLDGAMGTMIQQRKLDEAAFRGERFKEWKKDLRGHNDLLNLTQPAVIEEIHRQYFEAGADIVETNTFNAQAISLADYGMADLAYELNYESARLARAECDATTAANPDKPRYVVGALGPGLERRRDHPQERHHHDDPARDEDADEERPLAQLSARPAVMTPPPSGSTNSMRPK